jgi:hypothetical protein
VLVGWLVSRHARSAPAVLRGALTGGLALVCATTAYYSLDLLFDGGAWWGMATRYWLIGSVLFGPPLGAVGALTWRTGPIAIVAALLIPAGAALQVLLLPPPPDSRMAEPVQLSIWIAAAVSTVLIYRGTGRRGAAASPAEAS